ncbi:helix-turn-helix domain-containing protein [Rubellimicrobium roseum]|uniref:Helix-turn-helix transcriptional regulator n=1 Tax=Rubellimicrobium roseum TaxID=687525 RepID=A0A5C4NC96_9RHOB|nr:helix-turn-helix transcriptional regulator [Rubellimicrobium roseum]TNC71515.1 helix-turn-helix transcriptional regulator [Rubellimicrobium roseum]
MSRNLDKRQRATLFRERLLAGMTQAGMTQADLARAVRVDRSTVSQLLAPDGVRLPNAQVAAECAGALKVSADWLLGLSDRREPAADLVAAALTMTEAPRALVDDRIFAWHREAAGYKIRHVPTGLPDMLKTPEILRWESEPSLGRTTEQAIGASRDRLDWMRGARSDYEIALPLHELDSFARGEGYYAGLSVEDRRAQLLRMAALHEQLYPTLRVHLYDGHRVFSAPITVFGPLLAVIYLGHHYLAFRDTERVQAISRHFDALVREAAVPSRDFPRYLATLLAGL